MTAGCGDAEDLRSLGLIAGHVRIGDVDVCYLEGPNDHEATRTGRFVWAIGTDDDGLRLAMPLRDGLLVPGNGKPDATAVAESLAREIRDDIPPGNAIRVMEEARIRGTVEALGNPLAGRIQTLLARRDPNGGHIGTEGFLRIAQSIRTLIGLDIVMDRLGAARLGLFDLAKDVRHMHDEPAAEVLSLPLEKVDRIVAFNAARPAMVQFVMHYLSAPFEGSIAEVGRDLVVRARLHPRAFDRIERYPGMLKGEDVRLARAVPLDWLPDDGREWESFRACAALLDRLPPGNDEALVTPARGRWTEFLATLHRAANLDPGRPDPGRLRDAVDDLRDTLDLFLAEVVVPLYDACSLTGDEVGLAAELLRGGRGLPRMLEISRKQHRDAIPTIGDDDYREWEPILPSWTHPATGIEIAPIASTAGLVAEGMRGQDRDGIPGLAHCVGNVAFANRCEEGAIRIVSLRRDGQRLSTAEIRIGRRPEIVQHRSHRNGSPEAVAEEALTDYLTLSATVDASRAAARERSETHSVLDMLDEPRERVALATPEGVARAYARWTPYVVGNYRDLEFDDLARMAREAEGVAEAPAPGR